MEETSKNELVTMEACLNPLIEKELDELREKYLSLSDEEFGKIPEVREVWERYYDWLADQ